MKSPTGTSVWIDPTVYGIPPTYARRQPHQAMQQARWRYKRELQRPRRYLNPVTPIPSRASAQPPNATPGSIVKPDFSMISEAPTQPQINTRLRVTRRLPRIDEITTSAPATNENSKKSSKALVPIYPQRDIAAFANADETTITVLPLQEIDADSWTAGKAFQSSQARLIASRSKPKHVHGTITLNPIDHVRWWLLRPGHIEFVLWLGGTILLVGVTCLLLLVTAFSFEWVTPGLIDTSSTRTSGISAGSVQNATVVATATSGMVLLRGGMGPIFPGQSISIHGQGFSSHGRITFLFDGTQQLFDQNGQSTSTRANAQGIFTTNLVLNSNLPWQPGAHFIVAKDLTTNRIARLTIILAQAPIGKSAPSTPVLSNTPVVPPTALTPIPSVTGGQPVPVGQTPVPVTPAPHPGTPTVTPTVGNTPTITPTVGNTPTVVPTAGTTPGVTTTGGTTVGSGLGNALDNTGDTSMGKQSIRLSSWIWLMLGCYGLSMLLLGFAGVLHKRRQ